MADAKATASSGGIGFLGLLGVLFIALKLTGVINWSWVWVLAPLWGIPVLIVVGIAIFALIVVAASGKPKRKRGK